MTITKSQKTDADKVDEAISAGLLPIITIEQLENWFEVKFHAPLDSQFLSGQGDKPDVIQAKRQQTQHIKNILLQLKNKS